MQRRQTFWSHVNGSEAGGETEVQGDADTFRTGSDTIDGMVVKALHAHNQKDYEGAVEMYTDILAYQPADHVAAIIHSHRGMARFALGDADGAIADFTETIRRSPQTTRAYYYRGVVYRSQDRLDSALADFSRCLEYDPYHIESRVARARAYRDAGDIEAALDDCRTAQKLEPDYPGVEDVCRGIRADDPGTATRRE
jgi:putative GTP pyrophosphokinase